MSNTDITDTVQNPTTDPAKPLSEAEQKLRQALRDNPGSTAAALSVAAGIGKSTAPKILTRWAVVGLVTRTPATSSRSADHWSLTAPDGGATDGGATDGGATDGGATDGAATEDSGGVRSVSASGGVGDVGPGDRQLESVVGSVETAGGLQEKPGRLKSGVLRGMVEDFLRDNPGEFSPSAIGKALTRSPGAVHNAVEKLVEVGYVRRTCDKPRRYTLVASGEASDAG